VRKTSDEAMVYDEPGDWIVEQASQQGATISRRQLADWHRAGLIGKPDREFLGVTDGSESIYPHGTLHQAVACPILLKHFGSVERVGWELWMQGFKVAEHQWREPLRQAYEMLRLFLWTVASGEDGDEDDGGPEQSEAADRLIETIGERLETPRRLGVARRRLRRDGFKEFLSIVTSAAIGAFKISEGEASESGDRAHILSRLVGTEPGRHKAAIPSSPLLDVTGTALVHARRCHRREIAGRQIPGNIGGNYLFAERAANRIEANFDPRKFELPGQSGHRRLFQAAHRPPHDR